MTSIRLKAQGTRLKAQRCNLHWALRLVLCALCLGAVAPTAGATVILPASMRDIVDGSELIVHGRVLDVRSEMTASRRSIHTFVTVAVDEALKGRPGRTVIFRVPNGQVGRYRRVIVGAPEFTAGEEVVVFLHGTAPAIPTLFGLSQGVYRVSQDPARRAAVLALERTVRALAGRSQ
jgi:hypothetical protein